MGPRANGLDGLPAGVLDNSLINATPSEKQTIGASLNISQPFRHDLLKGTQEDGFFQETQQMKDEGGQKPNFGSLMVGPHNVGQDRLNESSKDNQPNTRLHAQMKSASSVNTPAQVKGGSQSIVVFVEVTGQEKMRIPNVPAKLNPDDEEGDEAFVLPILKFIERKGQKIDGKITYLSNDDGEVHKSLIGIYSKDESQNTIDEETVINLSEMELVGKKRHLNLIVESQNPAG